MDAVTLQEIFDSQVEFTPSQVCVILGIHNIWTKYHAEAKSGAFPSTYYKEMKELADEHEVKYTEPVFRKGLREVSTSPTLH